MRQFAHLLLDRNLGVIHRRVSHNRRPTRHDTTRHDSYRGANEERNDEDERRRERGRGQDSRIASCRSRSGQRIWRAYCRHVREKKKERRNRRPGSSEFQVWHAALECSDFPSALTGAPQRSRPPISPPPNSQLALRGSSIRLRDQFESPAPRRHRFRRRIFEGRG
ncbi:hypothetical protein V9T40_008282 [Parthenolecanium corni]|uniref:Uncharacterized protein n=1 Tax=Parthenolecanium corni TaxID=536013 RepID=A0AAN9TQ43_9HEMI